MTTEPVWRRVAVEAKGWLLPDEGPALRRWASLVAELGPLAEIGSYCGKSACWLGSVAQEHGTVLFSIDHHRGSPEMTPGRECHDPDVLNGAGVHDTFPHFRATIEAAGLVDHVVPVVGASQTVGRVWATPLAFLFIDGGHDTATVTADYTIWSPQIALGGILAFHDTTDANIGPVADRAAREGFTLLEQIGSLRVLSR